MIKKILFVCTANQCRSPVAERMMKKMLAREKMDGYDVSSAGTIASPGQPASQTAAEMATQLGIDMSGHVSRPISPNMLREADIILVMEDVHRLSIIGMCSDVMDKVKLLKSFSASSTGEEGIADPTGMTPFAYRTCFGHIMESLAGLIKFLKKENA